MPLLVDAFEAFAVDLDGVMWRGDSMLEGAIEAIGAIRRRSKPVLFLTNNGAYLPEEVARRLTSAGAEAAPEDVLTPILVARRWIEEQGLAGRAAFLLAPEEVRIQLADLVEPVEPRDASAAELVLVGRDTSLDFVRLDVAATAARRGAPLLALNRDFTLPLAAGSEEVGTGAILAAVEAASGRSAIVLGKPEAPMMDEAGRRLGGARVLMIGDRASSDVAGARRNGWGAALVLTGVGDPSPDPEPDYVLDSLADLMTHEA